MNWTISQIGRNIYIYYTTNYVSIYILDIYRFGNTGEHLTYPMQPSYQMSTWVHMSLGSVSEWAVLDQQASRDSMCIKSEWDRKIRQIAQIG